MPKNVSQVKLIEEFDRQVENLILKGYPKGAHLSSLKFQEHLSKLKEKAKLLNVPEVDLEKSTIPFVVVIKNNLLPVKKAIDFIEREGKQGIVKLHPLEPEDFEPISSIVLPDSSTYLLVDIDQGKSSLNVGIW